jgi:hypothetical protein
VTVDVELPRAATRTIKITITEPATERSITVLRQPLVRPMTVGIEGDRCGRS